MTTRASWLCLAVAATGLMFAEPASAQLFFDWGGQQKVNDTGRMSVRISADHKPGEIIVSFTDRKLFLITAPGQAISYPIAIPREQDRWEGKTTVTQKRENPSWTPTPTMIKENPRLPRWVPGGHPMNPLGVRALYLGSSFYRIHGTDAPWTIGSAVSKGCIRMYNKDALDLYERTKVGARVLVTWTSYKFTPAEGQDAVAQSSPAAGSTTPAAASASAPAPATAAVAAAPSEVPGARVRTARSDVGRIYESGPAEDFSSRRPRRQAEDEPDFSQPPRAASSTAADPAPADKAGRRDGQRRDQTARPRATGTTASAGPSGQRRQVPATTTQTGAPTGTPVSSLPATSSIDTGSVAEPVRVSEPAVAAVAPRAEPSADRSERANARPPAIANRAERDLSSNAETKPDKSTD